MMASSPPRVYRVFGLDLASDYPFKNRLLEGAPPAALTFTCGSGPVADLEELQARSAASSVPGGRGHPSRLFRLGSMDVLRFTEVADYYMGADRIDCHLRDPSREYLVEIELLGPALSFWLERSGIPTLHSSAVEVDGAAVGFLSSKNGGKTSLAAALMRRGHPLLTDDVLALEEHGESFLGRAGYPQMRMWPDQAAHYLDDWQTLDRIHPDYPKRRVPVGAGGLGDFCGTSRPLAAIYLPERRPADAPGPEVEIVTIKRRDAAIELLRHSFSPHIVDAVGWQARRLDFFARLTHRVPLRRVVYRSGFDRLAATCDAILADLPRQHAARAS